MQNRHLVSDLSRIIDKASKLGASGFLKSLCLRISPLALSPLSVAETGDTWHTSQNALGKRTAGAGIIRHIRCGR